jgi:hypothetical protein
MELRRILGSTRMPDITLHRDGHIDISAGVAHTLGIIPGDTLDIATDGTEYYLYISGHSQIGRHTARCYPSNRKGHHYRLHSRRLVKFLSELLNIHDRSHQLYVGAVTEYHARKLLPIILR